jgi:hypothetical protein
MDIGVTDDGLSWAKKSNGIVILSYNGSSKEVTIPSQINGMAVVEINQNAFYENNNITKVVIEEGISTIGVSAFYSCQKLVTVQFPSTLVNIKENAFSHCYVLTDVILPEGLEYIGSSAFEFCYKIKYIKIPNTVKRISMDAFDGCDALKYVFIPSAVTYIDYFVWPNNSNMIIYCEPTSKPSGWNSSWIYGTTVRPIIFYGIDITNMVEIDNTYYILDQTNNTANLICYIGKDDVLQLPRTITYNDEDYMLNEINQYAFYYVNLSRVVIPNTVTKIGDNAFYNSTSYTIYAYASSKPSGWSSSWTNASVSWEFTGEIITYTFVTNGGEEVESISSMFPINLPSTQYEGKYFGGWYTNPEFTGSKVTGQYFNKTLTTLYARWLTKEEAKQQFNGSSFDQAIIIEEVGSYSVSVTGSSYKYYQITVSETKTYNFYTSGAEDSYGVLYNSDKIELINDDDRSDRNYNFDFYYTLTAGQTYYLAIKSWEGSDSFTLRIV